MIGAVATIVCLFAAVLVLAAIITFFVILAKEFEH